MRTHRLFSPGFLLYFLALVSAPASDVLLAQSGQRSVVLQGGGWLVDMDASSEST